jgi:hypothetical protein
LRRAGHIAEIGKLGKDDLKGFYVFESRPASATLVRYYELTTGRYLFSAPMGHSATMGL